MDKKPKVGVSREPRSGKGKPVSATPEHDKRPRPDTRHDEIRREEYKGRDLPGAAGFATAGAEEDTYD